MGAKLLRVLVVALVAVGLPVALLSACSFGGSVSAASVADAAVSPNVNDFAFESMDVQYTLGRADDGTRLCWSRSASSPSFRTTTRTGACGAASPIRTSALRSTRS